MHLAADGPTEREEQARFEMLRRDPLAVTASASVAEELIEADANVYVALVVRAQAGDRGAFTRLIERRLDGSFRVARAILGNEADARDATQEAFLRAWRERRALRDPARFDAWLGRILVNSCREVMRGRRRRFVREIAASDLVDPVEGLPAREQPPDEHTAAMDTIERAFERLRMDERSILVLHHLERASLSDIAATLGVPVGTVKSRLHAARQSLERAMEAELQ